MNSWKTFSLRKRRVKVSIFMRVYARVRVVLTFPFIREKKKERENVPGCYPGFVLRASDQ